MFLGLIREVIHAHLSPGHVKFLILVIGRDQHKLRHKGVIHVDRFNAHIIRRQFLPLGGFQQAVGVLHPRLIGPAVL